MKAGIHRNISNIGEEIEWLWNHEVYINRIASGSFEVRVFSDGQHPSYYYHRITLDRSPPMGYGSLFFINGQPVAEQAKNKGFNIVAIDRITRQVIHWETFISYAYWTDMVTLAEVLPEDVVLLASVYQDYANCNVSNHCENFFSHFGGQLAKHIVVRDNYALIGYKGNCTANWITETKQRRRFDQLNTYVATSAVIPTVC